ncbi:MAG: hypothetical protein NC489_08165 [Ruminococcus flavefaciens]|nr:hypothetical protein [Ruminococcus flavefaciens]
MNWIQWNLTYIRIVNSCDNKKLQVFYQKLSELPHAFSRKRYIWNIIRGKSFYINAANYVIENVNLAKLSIDLDPQQQMDKETNELMTHTSEFIHNVLASEPDESVRKSFIWRIGKYVPFLTVDMIPYLSKERVQHILDGDWIINDPPLEPFITEIRALRSTNDTLREMLSQFEQ